MSDVTTTRCNIMATFLADWWEIDLAEGWDAESEETCTRICDPEGVGALQISAYRKERGKVTNEDLLDLAELDKEARRHLREQACGEFHGFALVHSEDEAFWRQWWLSRDEI